MNELPAMFRLLELDNALRSGRRVTGTSIHETLGCSSRSIQRDLDLLKTVLGAPIETDISTGQTAYTRPWKWIPAPLRADSQGRFYKSAPPPSRSIGPVLLLTILDHLLRTHQAVNPGQVADELKICSRTVYRALEQLEFNFNAPLYKDSELGGYSYYTAYAFPALCLVAACQQSISLICGARDTALKIPFVQDMLKKDLDKVYPYAENELNNVFHSHRDPPPIWNSHLAYTLIWSPDHGGLSEFEFDQHSIAA